MNLRDVDIFVVVAAERRFDVAARRLSLSVIQLREAMRRLEHSVGAPLLADHPDEIRLTMVGAQFRFRAHHILEGLRAAAREARSNPRLLQDGRRNTGRGDSYVNADRLGERLELVVGRRVVARDDHQRARPALRMRYGDVEIDFSARTVSVAKQLISLTKKEFQLFAMIALERGEVCTRNHLIKEIWYRRGSMGQNTLSVHITTLRAKLSRPDLILTIRGIGYRMATSPDLVEAVPAAPAT